jgi:WhiB family redox-sensing transcriptional regulator
MEKLRTMPTEESWSWWLSAACRGMDSSLFFSPDGENGLPRRAREEQARTVCRRCPVRDECAAFAFGTRQLYGTWGGLTEEERQERLRARDVQPRRPHSTIGVRSGDG